MKVALVHDQLREFGGAERVLVELKKIFPQADVFTSTYDLTSLGSHRGLVKNWNIHVSWFGKIPILNRSYSPLRFLTPWIWESFDFSGYDLVISSSGSWMSKGIKTRPKDDRPLGEKKTVHISYIHHQPRYLYGYETAIEWQKYLPIKIYGSIINHFFRIWDYISSQRADFFVANSQETKKRIGKFYRRESTVIYPPVYIPPSLDSKVYSLRSKVYYLTVSRLARAKHLEVLINAANAMKFFLKIVGRGRNENYLRVIAGHTVEFLGNIDDEKIGDLYARAKAFLFSSVDEEFGMAPVEAMGYGTPVIAYASGGLKETVREGWNGYLFDQLDTSALSKKINQLESLSDEQYLEMRKNARKESEKYSSEKFKERLLKFIGRKINARTSRS